MAVFRAVQITNKGMALILKAQLEQCTFTLTKAKTGNGIYSATETIEDKTELKSPIQEFALSAAQIEAETLHAKFVITNKIGDEELEEGYYISEIGLYALDPDDGEILYALAIPETDKCDYLPAYTSSMPSTINVDFITKVSNLSNVTVEAPIRYYIYDDVTTKKYELGLTQKQLYYKDETETIFLTKQSAFEELMETLFDTTIVDEAFEDVYGDIIPPGPEPIDPHALPESTVAEAMDTEWHGESSTDPNAISSTGVENAMASEWHGDSSADENALHKEDIETIIN